MKNEQENHTTEEIEIRDRYVIVKEDTLKEAVLKITFAFLLTTVCGGLFTYYLSQRDKTREAEQRRFDQKSDFFKEICNDVDARYYTAYRCMSAYRLREPFDKQQRLYKEYEEAVSQWNAHRMRNLGLLRVYFPEEVSKAFEELNKAFGDQLHDTLRTSKSNPYLHPDYDLENASEEDQQKYESAHRVLKNYYPKARDRIENVYQDFMQKACAEM